MKGAVNYLIIALTLVTFSCRGQEGNQQADADSERTPKPPAACATVWSSEEAKGLVDELTAATMPGDPVWVRYGLQDGWYVVYAGESASGESCLGMWHGGEVKAYGGFQEKPALLTPLYGYVHPWQGQNGVADNPQPPEIKKWFAEIGVKSAMIIPARVEGFPFELSPFQLTQIALHEAFHIEVQMSRWFGATGDWPVWDRQPDRTALKACYQGDDSVESAFKDERDALAATVSSLLDENRTNACSSGQQFLSRRVDRYALLSRVRINDHDGVAGTCKMAEDIMELEEGIADFASWTWLYNLGRTSRDRLMARYHAEQDERFYLTGAMQMHAIMLMDPAGFLETTEEIAVSGTPDEGSLAAVLARELNSYCR